MVKRTLSPPLGSHHVPPCLPPQYLTAGGSSALANAWGCRAVLDDCSNSAGPTMYLMGMHGKPVYVHVAVSSREEEGEIMHVVRMARCAEEGRYLLGRLAHAHLREHRPGGVLLRSGHGSAKTQRLDGPHVVIDADVPGPGQQRGHQAVGVVGLSPGHAAPHAARRHRLGVARDA